VHDSTLVKTWVMPVKQPLLSIIIPAYNEEKRLPGTLESIQKFLSAQSYVAELLIIENGSTDNTYKLAQSYTDSIPGLRVIHEEQAGKGLAVKRGMLEATGAYRFICDADLSMPISEVNRFIPPAQDADIVIGSREAPGAVRYNEPEYRHLLGRFFNNVVRLLALPKLMDTQCGFKCFRASVAEDLFPYQTRTGWTFDVEILYIATLRGYQIVELGIPWYFNAESKVNVLKDARRVFTDLVTIRRNAQRGFYQKPIQ